MTDEESPRDFFIKRIFIKDLSFETPMGHRAFAQERQPVYSWVLDMKNTRVGKKLWEVVLTATATAKLETDVAYLIEAQQACIVRVPDLEGDRLSRVLAIEVPMMTFPFLRETVDNLLLKAGFIPIGLWPPDFEELYKNAKAPEVSA